MIHTFRGNYYSRGELQKSEKRFRFSALDSTDFLGLSIQTIKVAVINEYFSINGLSIYLKCQIFSNKKRQ